MTERWRRIKEVHQEALARDAELRAAYLDQACGQDDALRREVEELLRSGAQADADGFLDNPAFPVAQQLQNALPPKPNCQGSRRVPWWMYLVAASFIVLQICIPYLYIWGPADIQDLQARFENGAMLIRGIEANSELSQAGMHQGDRVVAIDGRSIPSAREWQAAQANRYPGQPQRWEILRGEQHVELQIVPQKFSWRKQPYFGYVITALGCLFLGLLIGFQRPADPVARFAAWFIMTASVAFGLPTGWPVLWRQLPLPVQLLLWIPEISRFVVEGIVLSFFVIFPRRLFQSRWPWALIWIPVLATLPWRILGFNSIIERTQSAAALPAWLNQAIFLRTMIYLAAALVLLVVNYRRLANLNERRRVRVLVAGTAVGFATAVVLVWFFTFVGKGLLGAGSLLFEQVAFIFLLTCPLAFYYAIIRHRVLDVKVIIRQGLQYALARGAVLGIVPVLAGVLVLDLALNSEQPLIEILRARGWIYLGLCGLVLLVYWQRRQWLNALDKRFFRERYDAQHVLRDIVSELLKARDFIQVLPRVVTRIDEALHAEFVSVVVRQPNDAEYRSLACVPAGRIPAPIPADSKLPSLARVLGKPLGVLSDSTWLERLPGEEIDFLRRARIDLLVPIAVTSGRREAFLVLGMKRSEEPYTREDQQLLEAIGSSLALLLEQPAPAPEAAEPPRFAECPDCGVCYERTSVQCTMDGAALTPVALPRTLSGRYRLERRRGRGGMGTVYEASDVALERRVAVKVIRDDLVHTSAAAQRFRRESRAAAAFSHPNVVTVHDYGVESGTRAFLVMELLTGTTLREEITLHKNLSPDRTLEIFRSVCAAVEAAHNKRLIHRDLKPENIFLAQTAEGKGEIVKVLDFGIAKFLCAIGDTPTFTAETAETAAGMVLGTPAYMSPEQVLGEEPTVLWDLWALAVVAYQMLAGVLPFALTTNDWARHIIAGRFTPIDERLADAPPSLQAFFNECFAPDQTKRPASVAEFWTKLEAACLAAP